MFCMCSATQRNEKSDVKKYFEGAHSKLVNRIETTNVVLLLLLLLLLVLLCGQLSKYCRDI